MTIVVVQEKLIVGFVMVPVIVTIAMARVLSNVISVMAMVVDIVITLERYHVRYVMVQENVIDAMEEVIFIVKNVMGMESLNVILVIGIMKWFAGHVMDQENVQNVIVVV